MKMRPALCFVFWLKSMAASTVTAWLTAVGLGKGGLRNLKSVDGVHWSPLARQAVEEGAVSPEDDLLVPRFYIRPGLEDYIRQVQGEE